MLWRQSILVTVKKSYSWKNDVRTVVINRENLLESSNTFLCVIDLPSLSYSSYFGYIIDMNKPNKKDTRYC